MVLTIYEAERRLINLFPTNDGEDRFRDFPNNQLRQAILGINCEYTVANIRGILNSAGFFDTEVIQARPCPSSFSIIIDAAS